MLDLTGLPALDVAIGLALIFFLLATLGATIQEFVAAIFGLRARTLEAGLRSMLEDPRVGWAYVDQFYDHPLIKSLYRTKPPTTPPPATAPPQGQPVLQAQTGPEKPGLPEFASPEERQRSALERTKGPSYISPRTFALVVLDTVAPAAGKGAVFTALDRTVGELPTGLGRRLQPLVAHAEGDVGKLRTNLEAWFDDTMARVSGWYKRKTQVILLVIGVVMVVALNANTLAMGERIWKDDTVRSSVVAQAQAEVAKTPATGKTAQQRLSAAANDVDKVGKVGVPMGWRGPTVPHGASGIALAVLGWLLTIAAISLGAPFWFDTLSRLSRLRSSGKPETPLPPSGSGKANERIFTPPQVPTVVIQHEAAEPGGGTP